MVGFDRVVRVLLGVVQGGRDELVEGSRVGRRPVCGHLDGHRPGGQRPGEERPGGGQIAPGGQPHVDDLPVLVGLVHREAPGPLLSAGARVISDGGPWEKSAGANPHSATVDAP